ncbi:MAG: VOC family protein [Anaerolineae bacterium]
MKHTIVHFDIPADDFKRAKAFHSNLFGWEFAAPPGFPHYWMFLTGDPEANAGGVLMARESPEQVDLVDYFGVESVEDTVAKVVELGGRVVVPKQAVPGIGWMAHFSTPKGTCLPSGRATKRLPEASNRG